MKQALLVTLILVLGALAQAQEDSARPERSSKVRTSEEDMTAAPAEGERHIASDDISDDATYILCEKNDVVRTVRIETKKNGGCITKYSKEGIEQVIGESWNASKCKGYMKNVRRNLGGADWKCRDISKARVSSAGDE